MSTTAGYFDETLLLNRIARAQALGAAGRLEADLKPFWETVRGVLDNTTMSFGDLIKNDKDYTLQVIYNHFCGESAEDGDVTEMCTPSCTEPSTNTKLWNLNIPIHKCFSLDYNVGRTNEMNNIEQYITARKAVEKMLIQTLAQRLIAIIENNIGVNAYTDGKGVVAGTTTTFNAAYWNSSLISELERTAIENKFMDPWYLDSGLLWQHIRNAQFNGGNANGVGDAAAFGSIANKYYADFYNMRHVHDTDRVMYMIDKGVIGLTSKSNLRGVDELVAGGGLLQGSYFGGDQWRWSEPMMAIPGLILDVHRNISCSAVTGDKVETFDFWLRWIAPVVPTGCTTTNTGILKMVCG